MTPFLRAFQPLTRRQALQSAAAAAATVALPSRSQEQSGLLTLLVGYPPGGSADAAARLLAEKLATVLGRPVIVDNKPGAGGQIAARLFKSAPSDGSTLFFSNMHTLVTVPLTMRNPGFDALKDFRPVGNFSSFEVVLSVNPALGVSNFPELRQWAARNRNGLNIGVPAPGSVPEFIAHAICRELGASSQPIPYKGSAPLLQDLLGNQVSIGMLTSTEAVTYKDKIRNLALTHRSPLLEGVPSFSEVGVEGVDISEYLGVFAPMGMPDALVSRFGEAVRSVATLPDLNERLRRVGQVATIGTAVEQAERMKRVMQLTATLMARSGFQPQ